MKEARDRAYEARRKVQNDKVDPIDERKVAILRMENTINFSEAAKQYIQTNAPKWKNPKSQQQWTNTIVTYCEPIIGSIAVDKIDTQLVLSCIKPIWITKTETASRVRGRIEIILDVSKMWFVICSKCRMDCGR